MLDKGVSTADLSVINSLSTFLSLTFGLLKAKYADTLARNNEHAHEDVIRISLICSFVLFSSTFFADLIVLHPAIVYGALYIFDSISMSAIHSLTSALVMKKIVGKEEKWSGERVYASIGWGISTLFIGWMVDLNNSYKVVYILNFIFFLCVLYSLRKMRALDSQKNELSVSDFNDCNVCNQQCEVIAVCWSSSQTAVDTDNSEKKRNKAETNVWYIFNTRIVCFLLLLVSFALSKQAMSTFGRVVFARNESNSSNFDFGMMVLFSTVFEWPLMFSGEWLLKTFGGELLIVIASLASILRISGYLYVFTYGKSLSLFGIRPLIWIELLHGIAFSLKDTAEKYLLVRLFRGQVFLNSLLNFFIGMTNAIGLIGAGILYERGPDVLFKTLIGSSFVCLIIFSMSVAFCKHPQNSEDGRIPSSRVEKKSMAQKQE